MAVKRGGSYLTFGYFLNSSFAVTERVSERSRSMRLATLYRRDLSRDPMLFVLEQIIF